MSKHHKIQFKKKKLNTYTNRYSVSLSSLYHLLRHWGSIHPNNRHCQQLAPVFYPNLWYYSWWSTQSYVFLMLKKILSKCARDQNIWKCISTSLENKHSSAYSCIYGWVGTVASELKTLIFIYFTSEIQFPVIHFTDKIHKTWFSWFLLCLCSHNIWAIPEDSVAGEGRKSEGEDGMSTGKGAGQRRTPEQGQKSGLYSQCKRK